MLCTTRLGLEALEAKERELMCTIEEVIKLEEQTLKEEFDLLYRTTRTSTVRMTAVVSSTLARLLVSSRSFCSFVDFRCSSYVFLLYF